MTIHQPNLRLLPSATGRFDVASQVIASGPQDTAVRAFTPISGTSQGQLSVRIGRLLVYVTDREALAAFQDAWEQAAALADEAFGQPLPPPVYKPRGSRRH